MLFKKIKPVTPSLRNKIVVKHLISKKFKKLLINKQKMQGRSIFGKITSHHIGGGNYFKYRNCDYKNFSFKIPCIFLGYDYDNFRSGWLGLVKYINGCYGYILAPDNIEIGKILNYKSKPFDIGNRLNLSKIPVGTWIYNIESYKNSKGKFIRSAGNSGYLKRFHKEENVVYVKMPSKEIKKFKPNCLATIGKVSNSYHFLEHYSKAGIRKIFNYRPHVRGEAKNAVDHHHGGKTKGGKTPKTPWGKIVVK